MIYFTSDQHYSHQNVILYCSRPFKDIEEMREALVNKFNAVVKPEDTVYHLGDFSLSKHAPGEVLPRLNGEHHLIIGNHDWCHPVRNKKPEKLQRFRDSYFEAGFKSLELQGSIMIGDRQVLMSHFPYYDPNPNFDQRYPDLRPKDEGQVLLHGHVHQHWLSKLSPRGSLMINVGVDVWNYHPVPISDVEKLINANE